MNSEINYKLSWLEGEATERRHILSVLQEIINSYKISNQYVIELGSGIGTNLALFSKSNKVLGIEGMADAATASSQKGIETLTADLEQELQLPPDSADWVLSLDVLEHLAHPQVCLFGAHKILKTQGKLIINVPNHFDWRGRLRIFFGSGIDSQNYFPESPAWEYPHIRFFTREAIEHLLNQCGFKVVQDYSSEFNSFPKFQLLRKSGFSKALKLLHAKWPNFFSSGFFLVCARQ